MVRKIFGEDASLRNLNKKSTELKEELECLVKQFNNEVEYKNNIKMLIKARYFLSHSSFNDVTFYLKRSVHYHELLMKAIILNLRVLEHLLVARSNKIAGVYQICTDDLERKIHTDNEIYIAIDISEPLENIEREFKKIISNARNNNNTSSHKKPRYEEFLKDINRFDLNQKKSVISG